MEHIKKQLKERYSVQPDVEGLVLLHNEERFPFHTNEYVYFLLVISGKETAPNRVELLELSNERVFVRTVHKSSMEYPLANHKRFNFIDWLLSGEIMYDKGKYLEKLKAHIIAFPHELREQRKLYEFSGYLATLYQTKKNLAEGNVLDAYSQILLSIHHWAHIVLIEEGIHPELTVWKQLRRVHPGVYKLYEELIASPETIEQRVELVMLACEFSVMSKMKDYCKYLLSIMSERDEPWSISELQNHPKLNHLVDNITLVIQKLVQGHHIKEIGILSEEEHDHVIKLKYKLEK